MPIRKNLKDLYKRKIAQNKVFAIRKLVNLKYRDGRSVAKHLSDFQNLVNQLSTMKIMLDDELQALLLLTSLPDSWETLVVLLSNSTSNEKLSLVQLKDNVFNEETRRKDLRIDNSQTLVVENKGRSKSRRRSRKSKDRSQSQFRRKFNCHNCGEEEHIKRNCKAWKNKDKKNWRS